MKWLEVAVLKPVRARRERRRLGRNHLILLPAALLCMAAMGDQYYYRDRIYPGVYVKDIALGGKTYDETAAALDRARIILDWHPGQTVSVSLHAMGIRPSTQEVFRAAFQQGRQAKWPAHYWHRLVMYKKGAAVPLSYELEGDRFLESLAALERAFNTCPQSAHFRVAASGGNPPLIPEKPGYRLVKNELVKLVLCNLAQPHSPLAVIVPLEYIPPDLTADSLQEKGIETLTSSFSTIFDTSKAGRVHNLRLAASHLHHTMLAPGEILSVNGIIGQTTPEKGYREAPVIVGHQLVPGFGGGLCQISSTLYNAALLANLQILERSNHNMTVPYIDPGRDATIAYGSRDLKFRNNRDHHILIYASIHGNTLTFSIFGRPREERVEIKTRELAVYPPPVRHVYDPNLQPGEEEIDEGSPGVYVEVWKLVYRDSDLVNESRISVDYYHPYPTVIRRGPDR